MMDKEAIKAGLLDNVESLVLDLKSVSPNTRGREWRWGNKNSLSIHVYGANKGLCSNFDGGWDHKGGKWGGDILDLIQQEKSLKFEEALKWASDWLGMDHPLPTVPRNHVKVVHDDTTKRDPARNKNKDDALEIWNESRDISGTAGELYLKNRGINFDPWPQSMRWSSRKLPFIVDGKLCRERCLVFCSTATSGETSAIQRVFIKSDGTPWLDKNGNKVKRSLGPQQGGAVRLSVSQSDKSEVICLAEGPETGLSVHLGTTLDTWVTLGSMARIDLSPVDFDTVIVICRDDDPRNAQGRKALKDSIRRWRKEGRTIVEALPFRKSRQDNGDFNDALQEKGPDYVRQRIVSALPVPAAARPEMKTIQSARETLRALIRREVDMLREWKGKGPIPVSVIGVDLGVGKTESAIKEMIAHVQADRGSIVYAVPTHKLSSEIAKRFRDAGGEAEVWYGREATNPETGDSMCGNIDAVRDVQAVGYDPQSTVCRKELEDGTIQYCPLFETCAYQKQRLKRSTIWIVSHALLFSQKPEAIPNPSLLVIDEDFWRSGLRGVDERAVKVSFDQIDTPPQAISLERTADIYAELWPIRQKLSTAIRDKEDGPIKRECLIEAGLTAEECRSAAGLEWQRKIYVDVRPDMSTADRREILKTAQINAEIPRLSRMWLELGTQIDNEVDENGRLFLENATDKDGGTTYRSVRMFWREDIKTGWEAPILHLDATANMDLIRPFYPQARLAGKISAAAPYQNNTQYHDKTFSKASLKSDKAIDKLWTWAKSQAVQGGGDWLVVVQKEIEDKIRDRYEIPSFIELAHHNGVRGVDRYRNVSGMIVAGRTLPPPDTVSRIASALSGWNTTETNLDTWYQAQSVTLTDRKGKAVSVETEAMETPINESIRSAICTGELIQIIGRGRGVNRGQNNPLKVIILGNVPLPIEIDALREYEGPSIDDKMLGLGAWIESAEHASKIFPELGSSAAVKMGRKRRVTFSYKEYLIGKCYSAQLSRIEYQRSGTGRKKLSILYDRRLRPDLPETLSSIFDDIKFMKVEVDPLLKRQLLQERRPVTTAISVNTDPSSIHDEISTHGAILRPVEGNPVEIMGRTTPESINSYTGGILPKAVRDKAREVIRGSQMTQQQIAKEVGVSRPQLTNALQGRFGLGKSAAIRLKELILSGTTVRQSDLFHPV